LEAEGGQYWSGSNATNEATLLRPSF
jgi:hypothetical protein